jgi:hypothetical protein
MEEMRKDMAWHKGNGITKARTSSHVEMTRITGWAFDECLIQLKGGRWVRWENVIEKTT